MTTTQDISSFDGDPHVEATHQNMVDAGVRVETPQIVDYWSFSTTERFMLPDGVQYIEFKKMTEADKTEFQAKTNRDIRVQSTTKDIKLRMDPGLERRVLLDICVTGWLFYRPSTRPQDNGALVQIGWDKRLWAEWLTKADPEIVQNLEKAIRDANPWMRQQATPEEIKAEIASLQEQLEEAELLELEK
ncbi:pre-TMP frameshift protein [Rhodococcus phage ReqiDocB7]|nr:tail assembly chaperone [Rhodococcus phage ReqiDocB7]ADD80806.1 pre-TMP frameshift protein [Rhodococcus phage ReqiDocB7]